MSKHHSAWVAANYKSGDWVVCQCFARGIVKNKPLPGEFPTCGGCGNNYVEAEAAFLTLSAEHEAREKVAIEEKEKAASGDEEDGFPNEKPADIATAVYNTFKDVVRIAHKKADESCWDKSKLGDSVFDCMETFNEHYSKYFTFK